MIALAELVHHVTSSFENKRDELIELVLNSHKGTVMEDNDFV